MNEAKSRVITIFSNINFNKDDILLESSCKDSEPNPHTRCLIVQKISKLAPSCLTKGFGGIY